VFAVGRMAGQIADPEHKKTRGDTDDDAYAADARTFWNRWRLELARVPITPQPDEYASWHGSHSVVVLRVILSSKDAATLAARASAPKGQSPGADSPRPPRRGARGP
jgi:hypothetical protein